MYKRLKPGQLCTVNGGVYRCSKRSASPCSACRSYYGGWYNTPCYDGRCDLLACRILFGNVTYAYEKASFPILVSMCKK